MNQDNQKVIKLEQFNTNSNLKIDKNFFERRDVNVLESIPGGKEMILFYIKLVCICNEHNGKTHIRGKIKDDENLISALTNTPSMFVRCSLDILGTFKMIKRENGIIKITGGYYSD